VISSGKRKEVINYPTIYMHIPTVWKLLLSHYINGNCTGK